MSLSSNQLSGSLPSYIADLTKIYYFSVANNDFTGTIPELYTSLLSLQRFDVYGNYITGTIPSSFGSFTMLSILHLFDNIISGSYPSSLASNSRLRYVEIMRNRLIGTLPAVLGDEHIFFKISQNMMTGAIPASLLQHTQLDLLYLDDNYLSGSIPLLLNGVRLESLHLEKNFLSGTLSSTLSLLSELQVMQLSHNLLSKQLPHNFTPSYDGFYMIDISDNRLSGTLHDNLLVGENLKFVYFHENKLFGTIPNDLVSIANDIEQLTLYSNKFSGTIPESLGLSSKLTTLLLQNNKFSGHVGEIFRKPDDLSLTPFSSLQFLDISSNRLSGSVPMEIFQLPSLRHIAIIDNCFTGSLPEAICDAKLIEGLLLEGLRSGVRCRSNTWDPAGLTNTYFTSGIAGSIPACIFSLPHINILHISGNRLSGSLPSTLRMPKLMDLKLSDNRLSGYIPDFLQKQNVANIDLSRNRFKGSFDLAEPNDPSLSTNRTTSLKLSVNRLSGEISREFNGVEDVDVLKGNLFKCRSRNELPSHDPDSKAYVCGSDQFDSPFGLWIICIGVVIAVLLLVVCVSLYGSNDKFSVVRCLTTAVRSCRSLYHLYFNALSVPEVASSTELLKFIETLTRLRVAGAVLAIFTCVCFGFLYYALKEFGNFGSHVHQYRWLFSAAYLSGLLPAILMLSLLIILLFLVVHYMRLKKEEVTLKKSRGETAQQSNRDSSFQFRSYSYIGVVSLFNILFVVFVKSVYIYLLIWQDLSYRTQIAVNVAVSVFDVFWNTLVVAKLVSLFSSLVRSKTRIRWHLLLLLFNSIVAPMVSAACTDRSCFVEVFVGRDSVVSKSQYSACTDASGNTCSDIDIVELSSSFTPPFSYSYQCMSSILTSFIPVFLFSHILVGFLVPVALICCLCLSTSHTRSAVTHLLPIVLFPEAYYTGTGTPEKILRPGLILSNLLNHFAVMLTFGVAAPLLAICIAWTIFVLTWIWQLVIGRFVQYHINQSPSAPTRDRVALRSFRNGTSSLEALNSVCTDTWQGPSKAVWVIVDYTLLFFICLSVDIVGDVRGWLFSMLCIGIPAGSVMIMLRCAFRDGICCRHSVAVIRRLKSNPKEAIYNMSVVDLAASPMSHGADTLDAGNEDDSYL